MPYYGFPVDGSDGNGVLVCVFVLFRLGSFFCEGVAQATAATTSSNKLYFVNIRVLTCMNCRKTNSILTLNCAQRHSIERERGTGNTNKHYIYFIIEISCAKTLYPNSNDKFDNCIGNWGRAGADVIVSLLRSIIA